VTDQGLWPLPLPIQVLIARVFPCLLTPLLYHVFRNLARLGKEFAFSERAEFPPLALNLPSYL